MTGSRHATLKYESHYFKSRACLQEMRVAIEERKNILLFLETDHTHGAVPLKYHKKDCQWNIYCMYSACIVPLKYHKKDCQPSDY